MKHSLHRYAGIASITLFTGAFFVACGGLDSRKVTRDPVDGTGNQASGGDPGSGGSDARGGDQGNPFGGALFEGGAPPVLDGPPEVVEVDPPDLATDVDVGTSVSLLFSEVLDPATVTSASVQVLAGAAEVAGDLSLDQDIVATFQPTSRLGLAAKYDVTVSTDVTDSTGTPMTEAFASSFTTRDGEWQAEMPFVDDAYNHYNPYGESRLAIDDDGNVLVVWQDSGDGQAYGRWYRQSTGWQAPQLLSNASQGVTMPDVAVSPEGDAVVVWGQYVGPSYNILARRYVNGAWGGMPEVINGSLTTIESLRSGPFVKLKGGHLIIWWTHHRYVNPNYYYYLYAVSTTTGGAWPANPSSLDSGNSTATGESLGFYSAVAMDSAGNGMLIHNIESNATSATQLKFSKYVAATNDWEYPADLTGATGVATYEAPAVALDENGAAMVVWPTSAAPFDVMASRYTKAKGFAAPEPVDDLDTTILLHVRNALVSDGTDFFVSWGQLVGSTRNAYANRYSTIDAAWSGSQLISDGDTGLNGPPSTSADSNGNAMSIWLQGSYNAATQYESVEYRFARYTAESAGWAAPGLIWGGVNFSTNADGSVAATNGIVAALTQSHGFTAEDPGQPFLSIFE